MGRLFDNPIILLVLLLLFILAIIVAVVILVVMLVKRGSRKHHQPQYGPPGSWQQQAPRDGQHWSQGGAPGPYNGEPDARRPEQRPDERA